jgi:hypothetical protein
MATRCDVLRCPFRIAAILGGNTPVFVPFAAFFF